jgi:hypothetical protein
MTNQEINDPNIWVCAWKKTGSVLSKHILYAAYIIVGLTILAAIYFGITWIVIPVVVAAVTAIPWPVYLVVGVPVIYYGYGVLWCIARDLTDGDWHSDPAKMSALIGMFVFATLSITSFILFAINPGNETALELVTFSLFITFGGSAIFSMSSFGRFHFESISATDKPYRFIGAMINHYRSTPK